MDAFEYQQSLMDEIIQIKIKNRDLPEEKDHEITPNYLLCRASSRLHFRKIWRRTQYAC
jgi:hypothetical protein